MRGVVTHVSKTNGFIAIRTDAEEYTIAELLGAEVAVGDVLEGDLEALAGETLQNVDSLERIEVFIQDIHADAARAAQLLGMR